MTEHEQKELDSLVHDALSGQPRAKELNAMREVLEERIAGLAKQRDETDDEHEVRKLEQEIRSLRDQTKALREEEIVARFVEDSVTFAWNVTREK